jgi:hypothetical protein
MSAPDRATPSSWTRVIPLGEEAWLDLVGSSLFVGDAVGPKREVDPANPVGLLPCLERPRSVVLDELADRERELSLPSGFLVERVPLSGLPAAAVSTQIDYWVQLALDWLSGLPASDVDRRLLKELADATWATQRARHRARRLSLR